MNVIKRYKSGNEVQEQYNNQNKRLRIFYFPESNGYYMMASTRSIESNLNRLAAKCPPNTRIEFVHEMKITLSYFKTISRWNQIKRRWYSFSKEDLAYIKSL